MLCFTMETLTGKIRALYRTLLKAYGPQGWWPLALFPAVSSSARPPGYHPGDYSLPTDGRGRFEVAVGAVLTQNTAWKNVEKAMALLRRLKLLSPSRILAAQEPVLGRAIRASGYYNQKVKKLKLLARFFQARQGRQSATAPSREALLGIWGIGPETADSILLYAFHTPIFVIDAYTRRLLFRLGWAGERAAYEALQSMFHEALPRDHGTYNEYHALIVEQAKRYCMKKPVCTGCPVRTGCAWSRQIAPGT
jgi:endonuclease III related protein